MPLNRKPRPTISVPNVPKTPYDLSNSGTFTEGDFQISRQGLRISNAASDLEAADAQPTGGGRDEVGRTGSGENTAGTGRRDEVDAAGGARLPRNETASGDGAEAAVTGAASRGDSGRSGRAQGSGGAAQVATGGDASGGGADGSGGAGGGGEVDEATADSEDRARSGDDQPSSSRGSDGGGFFDIALEELEVLGVVGRGSSGSVQRARHTPSGNMLAVKVVQMNVQAEVRKNIIQELRTLHQSSCPHIVPYHGAFFSDGSISIILDYMDGGSLADVTQALGVIPETQLAGLAKQVLQGLTYLHKDIHIIHRDVKPSNLLVNRKGEVKISDFGVSGQLANSVTKCNSWVGTVTYMSPERISGRSYSFDSDVWSFGLSLVECAIGRFPYPPPDIPVKECAPLGFWDLLDYIVEEDPPRLPEGDAFPTFSEPFRLFVAGCLRKEPKERMTAPALSAHAWMGAYQEEDFKLAELIGKAADLRATA